METVDSNFPAVIKGNGNVLWKWSLFADSLRCKLVKTKRVPLYSLQLKLISFNISLIGSFLYRHERGKSNTRLATFSFLDFIFNLSYVFAHSMEMNVLRLGWQWIASFSSILPMFYWLRSSQVRNEVISIKIINLETILT